MCSIEIRDSAIGFEITQITLDHKPVLGTSGLPEPAVLPDLSTRIYRLRPGVRRVEVEAAGQTLSQTKLRAVICRAHWNEGPEPRER